MSVLWTHVHDWDETWSRNESGHWHMCTAQGCEITDYASCGETGAAYAPHVYDDDHDADCNVCGATRSVTPSQPTYSVSGKVTENGAAVPGAKVRLMQGKNEIYVCFTDENGEYSFSTVAPGDYNVVAEKDGKTMTILVTVTNANAVNQDLTLPTESVNSVLNVQGEDTPDVVVGGLEQEADSNKETGSTVTVTMTVEKKDETADNAAAIQQAAGNRAVDFLEIKVEKTVIPDDGEATTTTIATTENLMQIIVPYDLSGKENVAVYRYHGDDVDTLTAAANADDEYFELGADQITLYARNFSTYAIGYTIIRDQTAPSGSGDDSMPGTTVGDCPKNETCPIWPYIDSSPTAWYHDGVHYCLEKDLMEGYGNGKFGLGGNLTRAELAQILYNRAGKPFVTPGSSFEDVRSGAWYAPAVTWASSQNVVYGYGDNLFGPNDDITREHLAVMLWRYAGQPETAGTLGGFTDAGQVSEYAEIALRWAVETGIVQGKGGGILDPKGNATRAEVCTMLMRYFEMAENQ